MQKKSADPPIPYIDHEVKILRVIKDDGKVGKHKTIQVGQQPGGVVVSEGTTFSIEPTEPVFKIQQKIPNTVTAATKAATPASTFSNI